VATFDCIVVGSGVAGLSTAMHMAMRGQRVLVLEKGEYLASGATSRAAGLIGQMRSTVDATRMIMQSIDILYSINAPFIQSGSVRVAQTPARARELMRDISIARSAGLQILDLDQNALAHLCPFMRRDDVLAACLCPTDGYLEPPLLAQTYIDIAEKYGATFKTKSPVTRILTADGCVTGVEAGGRYEAPIIVNAAGPWTHLVARNAQQHLPTAGIYHFYLTTAPDSEMKIHRDSPSTRDRELRIYTRPKDGGIRVGIYEVHPIAADVAALPENFRMDSVTATREHPTVRELFDAAARRFPQITRETPAEIAGGIMAFTPDGGPLIGEIPGIKGLFHCAGFCGHGVTQSAAIGAVAADLILEGRCKYNLEEIRADRFAEFPELHDPTEVERRSLDVYSSYYALADEK
jgi:glycine/D-amino acid oxidase-like deaminating enzyme